MSSDQCKVQSEEGRGLGIASRASGIGLRFHTLHFALCTAHFSLRLPQTRSPLTLALSPHSRGEGTRAEVAT